MPELPDITVYVESLTHRVAGRRLRSLAVRSPFLVRTVDPPIDALVGLRCRSVERLGKRVVLAWDQDLFLVFHLMIAGRFRWSDAKPGSSKPAQSKISAPGGKLAQAMFDFENGTLTLTEAGTKKRASLHLVRSRNQLAQLHAGGLDPLTDSAESFRAALTRENRTAKRALTDPRILDGIGNAYSDEILHVARLSPFKTTGSMTSDELQRLRRACSDVLLGWTDRLRRDLGLIDASGQPSPGRFPGPGEVTAFRPDFAVHGRFGKPCPICRTPIQRIVYAENECNYCPLCQTEGRILADRSLSRLLRNDWPRTIDDLEKS